jgi:hypothetical protein
MSQLTEIIKGWGNLIYPIDPKIQELAIKRINVCIKNDCKCFKKNKTCAMCGCYMPAKVRSRRSKCLKGLW